MLMEQTISASLLTCSGVLNTVLNKHIVSDLGVRAKFFVLLVQTAFIVLLLGALHALGVSRISFDNPGAIAHWPPNSMLLVLMIYTGMQVVDNLPISIATILKNFTLVIVVSYDAAFAGYVVNLWTVVSFFLVAVSSVLGSFSDRIDVIGFINYGGRGEQAPMERKKPLESERVSCVGLLWILMNCLVTAMYTIYLNFSIKQYGLHPSEATMYTNLLAIPFLALGSVFDGTAGKSGLTQRSIVWIAVSGFTSFLVSYSYAWSSRVFSATTMTMIGALNKIPMAISGMVFGIEEFGSATKWSSILLGSLAALMYVWSRR